MSIEKNIEVMATSLTRIAAALELIAQSKSSGTAVVTAPPATVAPAPVAQAVANPVVQQPVVKPSFDAPVVQQPVVQINTAEEMNALLVTEFERLMKTHGDAARDLIVAELAKFGSQSVQAIPPANYPAILANVQALK